MPSNVNSEAQKHYSKGDNVLEGTIVIREAKPKLKAKQTVNIKGLGSVISGLFFVEEVTHKFDNSSGYTQDIKVTRSGFGTSLQLGAKPRRPAITKPKDNNKPKPNKRSYKVLKGDTLWAISKKFYGDPLRWKEIAKANNINWNKREEYRLQIGRVLIIP